MSESPSAASETPEAELVRLRAALRSEQDKVAALQADVQHLKVNQVEIVRPHHIATLRDSDGALLHIFANSRPV